MELYLTKGGNISTKEWEHDEEKEKGEYIYTLINDYSHNILNYLQYNVSLEEGYTCRDLMELVCKQPKFQLLDSYWDSFIDTFNSCAKENCISDDIDYIRLYKTIEQTTYTNGNSSCETWVGLDAPIKDDEVNYSMSFMKMDKYLDHELKFDKLTITKENYSLSSKDQISFQKDNPSEKYETDYTLWEILHAFIYELSFYGTPEETEETRDELLETSERIKNGTEKLVTFNYEDFIKDMKED